MHYPRDVAVWEHAPGRKIAELVIRLRNEKGAMATCGDVINRCGVNILTGFFTAPSSSPLATLSFFADMTDATESLTGLRRALQGVGIVESVEAIAAEDGFMVDKQHFPVQWAGRKALLMRADALNEMLNRLWDVFGTGAATIIDQMAEAMGRHFARETVQDFGAAFASLQLDELLGTYTALGYAKVSIERSRSADFPLVVNATDLFECDWNSKHEITRRSVFFRAHLRGFVSGLFERPFEVTEVQCLAEGDETCSFRVAVSEAQAARAEARVPSRERRIGTQSNL